MQLHGGVGPLAPGLSLLGHGTLLGARSWKVLRRALADAHNWPLQGSLSVHLESSLKVVYDIATSPLLTRQIRSFFVV